MLKQILRRVDWIPVGEKWSRLSIMGADLSEKALRRESFGESDKRVVILMIPGNPGNEGFYADFGERILRSLMARDERTGEKHSIYLFYTISHLNHVRLPPELERTNGSSDISDKDRFLLADQVQHKLDFVREHLPHANRVYLLGHSIGCYIMLRLLPYIKDDFRIARAICLFPTIERMVETPNGVRLRRVLATLNANDWLATALSFWLDWLPLSLKKSLVMMNLGRGGDVPQCAIDSAAELLHRNVFRNIIHMSNDELESVTELDSRLLNSQELIYFFYGTIDGWCPLEYGMEMSSRLPPGHVLIDDNECQHAFVIRDNKIVADKILTLIQ